MTISSVENRKEFAGNGVTVSFATPPFLQNSDIKVKLVVNATGVATNWVLSTQYTLSGAGDAGGGTLTVNTSPTDYTPQTGETLVVYTDPALTQATDLVDNDALPAETVEDVFDKLTLIAQRLSDRADRTLRQTDDDVGDIGEMPIKATRAGKLLGFDANGDPMASAGTGGAATTAFMATVLDDATKEEAVATLGAANVVDSVADLKAEVLLTNGRIIYLSADGRSGFFKFSTANLSSEVTADTQNGIYVPPNSDTTGTSGAWVRIFKEKVFATWFGADNTGATSSVTAVAAAIAYKQTIHLGNGTFDLAGLTAANCALIGEGNLNTVVTGNGDLLTGVYDIFLENMTVKNASTKGKLITHNGTSSRLGYFRNVYFDTANYHVYSPSGYIVGCKFDNCNFRNAAVWSRYYLSGLIHYTEDHCYTWLNKKGFYNNNPENVTFENAVFELNDEGAMYITAKAGAGAYGVKISDTRFEANGQVTPTEDITLALENGSGMDISLKRVIFTAPSTTNTVAKSVTGTASGVVRNEGCIGLVMAAEDTTWSHHDGAPPKELNAMAGGLIAAVSNTLSSRANLIAAWLYDEDGAVSTLTEKGYFGHIATFRNSAGTAINASTLAPDVYGMARGLTFTSGNSWDTPDAADLSFGNGTTDSPFSLVWLGKLDSAVSQALIAKYNQTTGAELREYFLRYVGTTGEIQGLAFDESANAFIERYKTGAITAGDGAAHCVVMTKSNGTAATAIKLYVDGVQVDNASASTGTYTAMENLTPKLGAYLISTGGAIEEAGGNRVLATCVISEELDAHQVHALSKLLLGYAGETV